MNLPWLERLLAPIDPYLNAVGGRRTLFIVLGVLLAITVLRKLFSRRATSPHLVERRCAACGWTGRVSKYKPICPSCGASVTG
jgi:hypothetical protein